MHINSYKTILALFKFGGLTKNRQTAKLKSPYSLSKQLCAKILFRIVKFVQISEFGDNL